MVEGKNDLIIKEISMLCLLSEWSTYVFKFWLNLPANGTVTEGTPPGKSRGLAKLVAQILPLRARGV